MFFQISGGAFPVTASVHKYLNVAPKKAKVVSQNNFQVQINVMLPCYK